MVKKSKAGSGTSTDGARDVISYESLEAFLIKKHLNRGLMEA